MSEAQDAPRVNVSANDTPMPEPHATPGINVSANHDTVLPEPHEPHDQQPQTRGIAMAGPHGNPLENQASCWQDVLELKSKFVRCKASVNEVASEGYIEGFAQYLSSRHSRLTFYSKDGIRCRSSTEWLRGGPGPPISSIRQTVQILDKSGKFHTIGWVLNRMLRESLRQFADDGRKRKHPMDIDVQNGNRVTRPRSRSQSAPSASRDGGDDDDGGDVSQRVLHGTKGGEQQTQNNPEHSGGNTEKQVQENEAASDPASLSGTTKEGSATTPSNISKSELLALKAQVDNFHNIAVEAAAHVSAAERKLREQKAAADAATKAAEETARKLAASEEEVEKLRLEVESYKEAARCAKHKLEASERDSKQLRQQVDSCTEASLKAAESQKKQQELEQQVTSFTEAAAKASRKVKDLQQQLQELKNDKEGLQKRFDEAQAKIASYEDKLSLSTSLMKESKDTMTLLNNELEAANAMKDDVQARLQACQSELKAVVTELESSKAANANAEQQLAGLANQASTLCALVNKKTEESKLKTQLIESLRRDLAATHQELAAKSEQLGQLESENRSLNDAYDVMSSERSPVFEHMKSSARETQGGHAISMDAVQQSEDTNSGGRGSPVTEGQLHSNSRSMQPLGDARRRHLCDDEHSGGQQGMPHATVSTGGPQDPQCYLIYQLRYF